MQYKISIQIISKDSKYTRTIYTGGWLSKAIADRVASVLKAVVSLMASLTGEE